MTTLAFDGRMGASGDMILGALLAAGADRDALAPVEDALPVRYEVGLTTKNGIRATDVRVVLTDEDSESEDGDDGHSHDHGDDGHSHDHDDHDHRHAEGAGPQRTYPEVVDIVEEMALPAGVLADATAVFRLLGEAEASVHGTDLTETHFHEVGADDAVADVVGACLLLDDLGVDRVVTTPVSAGDGTVTMSHGAYPVPPPAVVELAEGADWSLRAGPVDAELLTPTGAAILAHVAEGVDRLPTLDLAASGYGAGGYDFPERPNVLRALVGDGAGGLRREAVTVLETNVDDVAPEVLGSLQRTLGEVGARDVSVLPAGMKKSRPGHLVKVVCKPGDAERVARRLAEETGTLGVREHGAGHRWVADREYATAVLDVAGDAHEVTVKVARTTDGAVYDRSAEYDDALTVAEVTDLAVRTVRDRAETAVETARADRLVHVVEADRWAAATDGADDETATYEPASLSDSGFVHLSTPAQVVGVAQYNYPEATDPRLVVLDRERLAPNVKYEETPSGAFPHAYGPLNVDAVVDVLSLPREDGRYVLPDSLSDSLREA